MGQELIDGRFHVGQVIGKGNMGEVHRAEALRAPEGSAERPVAVKTILRRRSGALIDTGADTKSVERFAREVRIMRRLEHPSLYDHRWTTYEEGDTIRDFSPDEKGDSGTVALPRYWVEEGAVRAALPAGTP